MATQPLALEHLEIGGGSVSANEQAVLRLTIPPTPSRYVDAQVDDYRSLPRQRFPWSPPLHLRLRARASGNKNPGTLGFGFWNDPFTLSLGQGGAARRLPAAPKTLWFFYGSPPNDMALVPDVPGFGWKAACLNSASVPPLILAPLAAGAVALAQIPVIRRPVMHTALRVIKAAERLLEPTLDKWHRYSIIWELKIARFFVDGELVLEAHDPPKSRLGFVAWIDNQYAIASPQDGFRFGVLPVEEEQWLEIAELSVTSL
jgi:hypothetical protein